MNKFFSWRATLIFIYGFCAILGALGFLDDAGITPQSGFESLAPSSDIFLGSDHLGRCVASLVLHGAHTAFTIGAIAAFLAVASGTLLGSYAGFISGKTDALLVWLAAAFHAIPGILIVLIMSLLLGKGLIPTAIAIGIGGWVGSFRLARAEVQRLRFLPFIEAARVTGCSNSRIIWRHLRPNLLPMAMTQFRLYFIYAIKAEVIISYLGLGTIDYPSWGSIIAHAANDLPNGVWWPLSAATLALSGLVLALQAPHQEHSDAHA